MSRHPLKALDKAEAIAEKHGHIKRFERGPGMRADFTITIPECHASVKIRLARGFSTTPYPGLNRKRLLKSPASNCSHLQRDLPRARWICCPFTRPGSPVVATQTLPNWPGRAAVAGKMPGAATEGTESRHPAGRTRSSRQGGDAIPDPT